MPSKPVDNLWNVGTTREDGLWKTPSALWSPESCAPQCSSACTGRPPLHHNLHFCSSQADTGQYRVIHSVHSC
ncbi:hypothetical protein ACFPRL_16230 [Pseudoclavibacter helvolus]